MDEQWECAFCGKEVPPGCPHPGAFACCGEVGHVQLKEEEVE